MFRKWLSLELYLEFKATIGKKVVTIPAVKVADGVISTSELVNNTLGNANPALGEDAFQRIIKEKHDANIMFLIEQANIRSSELKTAKEFNKEVANVNEAANKKISNIEVSAYASPDGGVKLEYYCWLKTVKTTQLKDVEQRPEES